MNKAAYQILSLPFLREPELAQERQNQLCFCRMLRPKRRSKDSDWALSPYLST